MEYDKEHPEAGFKNKKTVGTVKSSHYLDYEYAVVDGRNFIYLVGEKFFLVCEYTEESVIVLN